VHVVRGHPPAHHPDHRERGGVESGEQQDPAARRAQARHAVVEFPGQQVRVGAWPQDVVAARGDADQVGRHLYRPRRLLLRYLAQQFSAYGQVGVPQAGLVHGQVAGEPVGPAPESVTVGQAVVQAFGEAVTDGDK
jgi:hypothetical protein